MNESVETYTCRRPTTQIIFPYLIGPAAHCELSAGRISCEAAIRRVVFPKNHALIPQKFFNRAAGKKNL
eukprot:scaffold3341_cov26-Prasinocladus_malaysianus.AAC.1